MGVLLPRLSTGLSAQPSGIIIAYFMEFDRDHFTLQSGDTPMNAGFDENGQSASSRIIDR
jgi:hypothetical protein